MKKWLDKYKDISIAQNGIEGTMGGLTDKGFNYNGAWGGTMQMGGSMPGAVGFTYARTGGIPSNGPYAKKTKASAQKGASVSDNTRLKPIVTEKPMNRGTIRSTEPFEPKDNRSIFSDSRAKERINSESGDFVQGLTTDTVIDQIPYSAYALTAKAINEGKPLTAISELVKQPLHLIGDVIVNALQENPKGIDVKTLEENTIPYARLAANALFGNPIITQIGRQRIESGKKKGSKSYLDFELPTLTEAAESYGVDGNAFTQFIENNWNSSGGSYKKILELADKKFPKKQNGGEMKFYQEGLDWKPRNISKQGSKIKKDDMGYWNPDNWGEPVEIGSNEITMQGVYEPLLGISDTGDTQMMYPGEDYTFDGESVTEYPVMQQGGRTPIYTENPKDSRIRAYQDSLSLYNQTQHNLKPYKTSGWPSSLLEKQLQKYWPSEISSMKSNPNDIGWYAINSENNSPTGTGESSTTTSGFKNKINPKILPVGKYIIKTSDNAADFIPKYKKPVQPVEYKKPEPKKEVKKPEPVKKEQSKPIERKQNIYEGSPVYSPGAGTGMGSALVGFANQKGDTTYIKPEDYERFAVPKYGKEFIESKKKKNGGWLEKYK